MQQFNVILRAKKIRVLLEQCLDRNDHSANGSSKFCCRGASYLEKIFHVIIGWYIETVIITFGKEYVAN
eukprot:snap_masked-scaffold_54-processed-gene-1.47-mRNA-1 protein AED:1.00 eAED:1.00 QI:0/0/0/0/1/1/2/0/68